MPALPAHHIRKAGHSPFVVDVLALNHDQEGFSYRQEEHSHEEGNYLGQNHQGEGELEFLLCEGVTHIHYVDQDQQDYEDQGVEDEEEGWEGCVGQVGRYVEFSEETYQIL